MPPKKDSKFYVKPSTSKPKLRRQLADEQFITPLQQFTQPPIPLQQCTQPPGKDLTEELMSWLSSSCPPDFLQQMKNAYEKGGSSSNNIASQSSQISQSHATLPDASYLQDQCDYVQSQQCYQDPSSYETPRANVRNKQKVKEVDETSDKKRNYTKPEDVLLCQIVSNLSDKPREERGYKFWNKITDSFNEVEGMFRSKDSLTNRWSKLKRVARAWKSACAKVDAQYHSGFSESMILDLKKQEYCAFAKESEFGYEHIVEHLSDFSKYNWTTPQVPSFNDDDNETRRTPGSQGSGKRSFDAMNVDSCEEADDVEVSSPAKNTPEFSRSSARARRPDGVKKTKEKEKAAREASGQFQSKDADLNRLIAVEQERELEKMNLAAQKLTLQRECEQRKRMEAELKMMQAAFATATTEEDTLEAKAIRKRFYKKWGNI